MASGCQRVYGFIYHNLFSGLGCECKGAKSSSRGVAPLYYIAGPVAAIFDGFFRARTLARISRVSSQVEVDVLG